MQKVTYIWKIKSSRPWTFHTVQSLRLRAISHLYRCSNSAVFVDVWLPWKNPSVYSQWYIKNECFDVAQGLKSRFRLGTSSTLQDLLRVFRIRFCFMRVLWHANQLRNGTQCACASADCVLLSGHLAAACIKQLVPQVSRVAVIKLCRFDCTKLKCRKIPKISPGAYIFQRPSLRAFFLEGLIFGEAYLRREICISKSIGLAV